MNLPPAGSCLLYMYIKTDILMSSSRLIFVGDRCATYGHGGIFAWLALKFQRKKHPVLDN